MFGRTDLCFTEPVLMFGKIECEVAVESYIDAFFKDFAFDVQ